VFNEESISGVSLDVACLKEAHDEIATPRDSRVSIHGMDNRTKAPLENLVAAGF
jgi:hypothetical protein